MARKESLNFKLHFDRDIVTVQSLSEPSRFNMLVCGKRAIASGKLAWKNLPITASKNTNECRIKLFQKEIGILDPQQVLYKFAIYAFEVKSEHKFECGFIRYVIRYFNFEPRVLA